MASLAALRQYGRKQLEGDAAALEADLLLAFAAQCSRTHLYTWPEKELNEKQLQHYETLLLQRQQGWPVAYLLGEREFWGLNLSCDRSTLIPRPDTEILVEKALEILPDCALNGADFGTGSGAIACALATERPEWTILALDKIFSACQLALKNCQQLGLNNIQLLQGLWGEALAPQSLDFIVSNPPYIAAGDPHLSQGDVRFEPASALLAENQGYADIEMIISQAAILLKPGGFVLFEHGYQQGEGVRQRFVSEGWECIHSGKDLAAHERISWARKPLNIT